MGGLAWNDQKRYRRWYTGTKCKMTRILLTIWFSPTYSSESAAVLTTRIFGIMMENAYFGGYL